MPLEGFKFYSCLENGSRSEVWHAHQTSLKRDVLLRFLKPEFRGDSAERTRFIQEARTIARLNHENIVAIYDAVESPDACYIIMEHVDGPTLAELIKSKGQLSSSLTLRVAQEVVDALAYAWQEQRLIHRNLTPRCVQLDEERRVRLNFVGLSLSVEPEKGAGLEPGTIEGTPYYMSTEQAAGLPDLDHRTDMYALGATLYHLATGVMPFEDYAPIDVLDMHHSAQIQDPRHFAEDLPAELAHVMRRLMMKNREARYADWPDVMDALVDASSKRPVGRVKQSREVSTIYHDPAIQGRKTSRRFSIRR